MASSSTPKPLIPAEDLESFRAHLNKSTRILALLGAGLSASSGLPTFRGAGGYWRTHDATELATPEAFDRDPGLVWQFYSYRRHMALKAKPNPAHYALAELAKKKEGFLTLSQNVDGLSPRAGHTEPSLKLLHGSLFDIRCTDFFCKYTEQNNYTDPIVPALAIPTAADKQPTHSSDSDEAGPPTPPSGGNTHLTSTTSKATPSARELDISDEAVFIPNLSPDDLPHCPQCKKGLLRPGVVWFGEMLPLKVMSDIDTWMEESQHIDLIMVIGTSARVYPAAGYVDDAREKGAKVAVINMDPNDLPRSGMNEGDWFFQGDAAQIVPEILKSVIGELGEMKDAAEEN